MRIFDEIRKMQNTPNNFARLYESNNFKYKKRKKVEMEGDYIIMVHKGKVDHYDVVKDQKNIHVIIGVNIERDDIPKIVRLVMSKVKMPLLEKKDFMMDLKKDITSDVDEMLMDYANGLRW
jgi:hypothetical protein